MITGMTDGVLIQWSLDKEHIDIDRTASEIGNMISRCLEG